MNAETQTNAAKKEARTLTLGQEFGFVDESVHPVLADVDWAEPDADKTADELEEQWVDEQISKVVKANAGMGPTADSAILRMLAERNRVDSYHALERYREMREIEGVESGEFIDGGETEMDDDFMDARQYALNEALLAKHRDIRRKRGN